MERDCVIVYKCGHCGKLYTRDFAARDCCDRNAFSDNEFRFHGQSYDYIVVINNPKVKEQEDDDWKPIGGFS